MALDDRVTSSVGVHGHVADGAELFLPLVVVEILILLALSRGAVVPRRVRLVGSLAVQGEVARAFDRVLPLVEEHVRRFGLNTHTHRERTSALTPPHVSCF